VTGNSTAIADRMPIGAGPFAHCRRVRGTAAATPSLRRRRRLVGGLRGRAGCTGSTTPAQPPTGFGELIEMRLAQVEFVAGRAVVHSNCRHGLGAVTVKIAGQHDLCCLSHDTSVQHHTSDRLLARIQNSQDRSISPLSGSGASDLARQEPPRIGPHLVRSAGVSEMSAHARAGSAAAPRQAVLVGRAEARDLV
jgi:hypothetical protein